MRNSLPKEATPLTSRSGTLKRLFPEAADEKPIVWTFLRGNGERYFVLSTRDDTVPDGIVDEAKGTVVIIHKRQRRGGQKAWEMVVDKLLGLGVFREGDFLLTDNENVLKHQVVRDDLDLHGVTRGFFPSYLGSLMNPADNAFHATFKQRFFERISTCGAVPDEADVILAAFAAFYDVPSEAIRNYFDHTGITSGNPAKKIEALLTEGRRVAPEWWSTHAQQAAHFLAWAQSRHIDPASIPGLDEPDDEVTEVEDDLPKPAAKRRK